MGRAVPFDPHLFAPGRRHLVVLAHQDDELPYGGLLQRLAPEVRVVWVTNGDGLAPAARRPPAAYAADRRAESVAAMAALGVPPAQLTFLGHSEIALYALLAELSKARRAPAALPPVFDQIAAEVRAELESFAPHTTWTLAYQGGHPEHDLSHLAIAKALHEVAAHARTPLFELPAYELTVLVPLRFRPWRRASHHALHLTDAEQDRKRAMLACYPTQAELIARFERLIAVYGKAARLFGRPFDVEAFAAVEVFAPVPRARDYTRSTHVHPRLDYIGEDFEGRPIRFERTLARIARAWGLGSPG